MQGALGPRPGKRPSGPEAPRSPLVFTFSFTAGLLAPEAPRHPLFPVSKKGPMDLMEALGASGELPHHVKVVPQSGEPL